MAVDWKTGALKWFFQATHHDWLDFDLPHPPMVLRVPIDGKTTPVVAEGSKGGFFYVLNATNGGQVPHFKITETPTYDPSGQGHRAEQPVQDAAVPDRRLVLHGGRRLLAGRPREVQLPGQPADRRVRDGSRATRQQPDAGHEPGEQPADHRRAGVRAHYVGQYLVYGGAGGGGIFGYPPSAYSPQTHTYYACLQNAVGRSHEPGELDERLDRRRAA